MSYTPCPAPVSYDEETGFIVRGDSSVARVCYLSDYPCSPHEIEEQLKATGAKLVAAYNHHDALIAAAVEFLHADAGVREALRGSYQAGLDAMNRREAAVKALAAAVQAAKQP